ncbi:hypothetical protein [Rhodococcus sp. H29-C3]|uniref:hypothetical protein n=1 Tax=Rhodococcus sp. H29-C3 TaxID=3046307 RepID=UPI0024BB4ABC|nr:hypothetical protein [Rhodococcus sp. H29-C3]MDJ0358895.1 hypothetical protein [Rhodococcus sp. H29-C3]
MTVRDVPRNWFNAPGDADPPIEHGLLDGAVQRGAAHVRSVVRLCRIRRSIAIVGKPATRSRRVGEPLHTGMAGAVLLHEHGRTAQAAFDRLHLHP